MSVLIPEGDGMSSAPRVGRFDIAENQPLNVTLPMKSPGSHVAVTGQVKWSGDADPNTGASVSLSSLDAAAARYYSIPLRFKDSIDESQSFTLENVEPGEYMVRFEGTTIEAVKLDRVTIPGKLPLVELHVLGKPTITGIVSDAATGQPVASFALRVRKLSTIGIGPNYVQSPGWAQVSDSAGHYSVDLVGPGVYQVQISTGQYAWAWSKPVKVEKPGVLVTADIPLTAGGRLRGTVLDSAGAPVIGAKVIPLSMAQSSHIEWPGAPTRFASEAGVVLTGGSGAYSLDHLAPGSEKLKIIAAGYAPMIVDSIVTEGQTTDVPATTLKIGGAVEGVVYDEQGQAAAGVAIEFQDAEAYNGDEHAGQVARSVSDAGGHYRVEHLAEQTLYVNLGDRWTHPGIARRIVRPMNGRVSELDFGGTTPITGRLVAIEAPKSNWKLSLSSGDRYFAGVMANVTTDADGRFTIRGVPAGRYVLYTDAGREKIPLREIIVGDAALDLGEVTDDRGRVVLKIEADDPADAAAIQQVALTLDPAVAGWAPGIETFTRDGDRWACGGVPAGRSVAQILTGNAGALGVVYRTSISRNVGQGDMQLTLRLSTRSATLRAPASTQPTRYYVEREEADGVIVSASFSAGEAAGVKLPPGIYHLANPATQQPLLDSPPTILRADESVELALSPRIWRSRRQVELYIWSIDGALQTTPTVTMLDAAGEAVQPELQLGHESTKFFVERAIYTVRINRPNRPVFEQAINFTAVSESLPSLGARDIVLPD